MIHLGRLYFISLSVFTVFACANAEKQTIEAKAEVKAEIVQKSPKVRAEKKVESKRSAKIKKASKAKTGFQATLERYHAAEAVKMDMAKRVYQALTAKEIKSRGALFLAKDRMRIEFSAPDKGLLVLDGETVWQATYLPEEFGGGVQVAKIKMNSLGKAGSWLAAVFGEKDLAEDFSISEKTQIGSVSSYTLTPKSGEESDIQKMILKVDEEKLNIVGVTILDQLENETNYDFFEPKFDVKIPKSKFKFTPPKGAEITEY